MVSAGQVKYHSLATRTESADFCRIFEQDLDRLYLLSFLLTGEEDLARRCFVGGLEDSAKGPRVFKEWAHSWARRMVIQNAIQMIRPQAEEGRRPVRGADSGITALPEISALVELPAFERFVFVMSVLERYSDQDCALLLDSTRGEVVAARLRAFQQIGNSAGRRLPLANTGSGADERLSQEVSGVAPELDSVRHLVTSA